MVFNQSKVDLINKCLLAIGEAPIDDDTVLDTVPLGTDIDVAKRMVESTFKEVLAQGFYFNRDYDYTLYPDDRHFISLPANVLSANFHVSDGTHQYVARNGRVYDTFNHTYIINYPVNADLIYYVELEELPVEAYDYIGARAARKFQEKVIGDITMTQINMQEELDALGRLQRANLRAQGYNLVRGSRITNAFLKQGLHKNRGRR